MHIDTVRFGQVEIDEGRVLTFKGGLPGLEEHETFAILQLEEGNPIVWLQCTTDAGVCLPVVDAFVIEPGYVFDLSDEDVAALSLQSPEDLHVLSVLVIPENIQAMTVNLAAPIVINMKTNQARQTILGGNEWGVRAPAFAKICQALKGGDSHAGTQPED
jgi:Uncharacterized protein conserved in bacteria